MANTDEGSGRPRRMVGMTYRHLLADLAHHPPLDDRRFWLAQALVVGAVVVPLAGALAHDQGVLPTPGFVWVLAMFVPLVYAGTIFGLIGSLGVTLEGAALLLPEELLMPQTAMQLWGVWSILAVALVTAVLLGHRYEQERVLRAELLVVAHQQAATYDEGHPLFGEQLLALLPVGVGLVDQHGVLSYVNARLETLAGYPPGELAGQLIDLLVPGRLRDAHAAHREQHAEHRGRSPEDPVTVDGHVDINLVRRDGSELPVDVALAPCRVDDEPWVVVTVRDDTVRRAAQDARTETERRFQLVFDSNVAGMLVVDRDDRALAVNDSFCQMLGRPRREILGQTSLAVAVPDDAQAYEEVSTRMLAGELSHVAYTRAYRHSDGRVIWGEVSKSLARDETGQPQYFIVSVRDVTEERSLRARLAHQALHDPLTGLANRVLFHDRLAQARARTLRDGRCIVVLLIDLDEFKAVNDTFGHLVGDELLVMVAHRLQRATRAADTLGRFGGDEFVYLCEASADPGEAEKIAQRLLNVFAEPFTVAGENVDQQASIGIAVCSDQADCGDLLRDADTALYDAKRAGKARYALFRTEMHDQVSARFVLVQQLRAALDADELRMHYQPIVDLTTGQTSGVEALMRWAHPEHGWVSPEVFIPIAEQSELILDLGSFALHQAVTEAASWPILEHRDRQPYVAVNLSPRQFHDPDLLSRIQQALGASGLPPGRLVLEITEGAAFADLEAATRVATRLRDLGIALAVDDFGTGYSSLSYFSLLRPRILKVDRSFVSRAHDSLHDERLLEAIVSIGRSLGVTVVAEGIETHAHRDTLRRLGCRYGQGYLFSPAVPPAELPDLFAHAASHS
ncbi:MAG: putative bifunctional diguanylate cyclase/phosphodiesterase [Actinomycetes bacterium]